MARLASAVRGVGVASVSRAMRVLETFAGHPHGLALTDVSAALGYGKASLSKILGTLEREGFVRRDALSGHFHLSWRLLALAFGHAESVGVPAICFPILQALADDTDELVQLAVVEGDHMLFVARAEGPGQRIRMLPLVGLEPAPHATASGKVWLASLPESDVPRILARHGLARLTPRTVTSRVKLAAQLRQARARGYAIVDEELVEGGRAVAAPVTAGGRVVGSVAVSGPTFRLSVAKLHRMAPRVRRAAAELESIWPLGASARDFGFAAGRRAAGADAARDGAAPRDGAVIRAGARR